MTKLNVGHRSKQEDAEALKALKDAVTSTQTQAIVEEDGATYVVEQVQGLTVKTRIA